MSFMIFTKVQVPMSSYMDLMEVCNEDGVVDFNLLLPAPADILEENRTDWERKNWGCKWGPQAAETRPRSLDQVQKEPTFTLYYLCPANYPDKMMDLLQQRLQCDMRVTYLCESFMEWGIVTYKKDSQGVFQKQHDRNRRDIMLNVKQELAEIRTMDCDEE